MAEPVAAEAAEADDEGRRSRLARFGTAVVDRMPALTVTMAAGIALYAAFPPLGWWYTAIAAFALLSWVLTRPGTTVIGGFGYGLLFGLTFYLPLLPWISGLVGAVPWLALSFAEALFPAAFGAVAVAVRRLPGWPVWFAGLWSAQEWLKSTVPFGGFPWGVVGYSQTESPLLSLAYVGGAPLVSFAVALLGFGLHRGQGEGHVHAELVAVGVELLAGQFFEQAVAFLVARPGEGGLADDLRGLRGHRRIAERAVGLREQDERAVELHRDAWGEGDGVEAVSAVEVGEAVAACEREHDVGPADGAEGGIGERPAAREVPLPLEVVRAVVPAVVDRAGAFVLAGRQALHAEFAVAVGDVVENHPVGDAPAGQAFHGGVTQRGDAEVPGVRCGADEDDARRA